MKSFTLNFVPEHAIYIPDLNYYIFSKNNESFVVDANNFERKKVRKSNFVVKDNLLGFYNFSHFTERINFLDANFLTCIRSKAVKANYLEAASPNFLISLFADTGFQTKCKNEIIKALLGCSEAAATAFIVFNRKTFEVKVLDFNKTFKFFYISPNEQIIIGVDYSDTFKSAETFFFDNPLT